MNQTERAFETHLLAEKAEGRIVAWFFEAIKLRLADRTWYTPDFFVQMANGTFLVVEVKGFWRDDARVKIKVAAEMYPQFRFAAARRRRGGGWEWEEFSGRRP